VTLVDLHQTFANVKNAKSAVKKDKSQSEKSSDDSVLAANSVQDGYASLATAAYNP
jgi:hypothetical protein